MTASTALTPATQIEFTLTPRDFVEANQIVLRRRFLGRKGLSVGLGAALAWVAWSGLTEGFVAGLGMALGLALFAPLSFCAIRWIFHPLWWRWLARSQPRFASPWRVTIADDGLHIANVDGETRYAWSSLVGRHTGHGMVALLTRHGSSVPLPRRALTDTALAAIDTQLMTAGVSVSPT